LGFVAATQRTEFTVYPKDRKSALNLNPRLLIITSHPIQYQVPWFRALHANGRIRLKVLFLSLPNQHQQGVGFNRDFEWDVPLLDGYDWELAPSASGSILGGWNGLRLKHPKADIRAQGPDAVLVTGWQNRGMLQSIIATSRLKLPLMLRAESNGLAPIGLLKQLKSRWIVNRAQMLLPIGEANRKFYAQIGATGKLGPDVPYFVDNAFFNSRADSIRSKRASIRSNFGIPNEAVCFLFAGKFIGKKRPTDILRALQSLKDKCQRPLCLLMVGTGPLEASLKELAAEANLPVKFAGFLNQTEIPAAYVAADCLVLPSDYGETWGLVVNEAMACGLPAIVSDRVGCGPDLVIDAETGFRFRFGDIEALAVKTSQFLAMDRLALNAMGEAARLRVFTDYSIERAVENTVAATLELASTGDRNPPH